MKLTQTKLKQIVKEEISKLLSEFHVTGYDVNPHEGPQGMKEFVQKWWVEPEYGDRGPMNTEDFEHALEKFEVEYKLDFPDSIFKLHDIFEDMNENGLARGLVRIYGEDWFEDRPLPEDWPTERYEDE